MGVQLVRVPPGWRHPVDEDGEFIVGAHHEPLYYMDSNLRTAFQLYENVSEGSPTSLVFGTVDKLIEWLTGNGWSQGATQYLLSNGHSPSLVIRQP